MTESIQHAIQDVQEDVLVDLYEAITNEFAAVEQNLMDVHLAADPLARIEAVYGFLKNIEGNSQQTFIEPYIAYIHACEDVLSALLSQKLPVTEHLSELLLLALDQVRAVCESLLYERKFEQTLISVLTIQLKQLKTASGEQAVALIAESMNIFASKVNPDLTFCATEVIDQEVLEWSERETTQQLKATKPAPQTGSPSIDKNSKDNHEILPFAPQEQGADFVLGGVEVNEVQRRALASFKSLAEAVEVRSPLWENRSSKILYGCLIVNRYLPDVMQVSEMQLQAAVYMHDVFMSLLPDDILFKKGKYESTDIMLLQQHPIQGYEMLRLMPDWQQAADMVHEHHERFDGKGYPRGMSGEDIHLGAQIIALMDAFFSMTHLRADREYKKSVIRAVMELNNEKGGQFNPLIIEALNKATAELIKSNRLIEAETKLTANA